VVLVHLVQLQNHHHPWTVVIKTEFSDRLEIFEINSVPMNGHGVKFINQFLSYLMGFWPLFFTRPSLIGMCACVNMNLDINKIKVVSFLRKK
jgi:hypothetical protein